MIYSIVTVECGRVEEVKTFQRYSDAKEYFSVMSDWGDVRYGSPDEDNKSQLNDVDDFGEAELVFCNGDCRVSFITHVLN